MAATSHVGACPPAAAARRPGAEPRLRPLPAAASVPRPTSLPATDSPTGTASPSPVARDGVSVSRSPPGCAPRLPGWGRLYSGAPSPPPPAVTSPSPPSATPPAPGWVPSSPRVRVGRLVTLRALVLGVLAIHRRQGQRCSRQSGGREGGDPHAVRVLRGRVAHASVALLHRRQGNPVASSPIPGPGTTARSGGPRPGPATPTRWRRSWTPGPPARRRSRRRRSGASAGRRAHGPAQGCCGGRPRSAPRARNRSDPCPATTPRRSGDPPASPAPGPGSVAAARP